jgi:hypothetical protein
MREGRPDRHVGGVVELEVAEGRDGVSLRQEPDDGELETCRGSPKRSRMAVRLRSRPPSRRLDPRARRGAIPPRCRVSYFATSRRGQADRQLWVESRQIDVARAAYQIGNVRLPFTHDSLREKVGAKARLCEG